MSELFMIARIAGRAVAVAAHQVGSVVDIGGIVRVPLAPAAVRGVAALRSQVVTVIDPGVALRVATPTAARRAIVIRVDGHHYAILADAVDDVAPFDRLPLASGVAPVGGWADLADGMVEREDEVVLVVDLFRLIPALGALGLAA